LKAPEDRMEMLLEAIYSKMERMGTIMDRKPSTGQSQQSATAIPGSTKLQEIKQQLTRILDDLNSMQSQAAAMQKHHYQWFFPDLKKWLTSLKSRKFVVLLLLLSLALLTVMLQKYPDFNKYQDGCYNLGSFVFLPEFLV